MVFFNSNSSDLSYYGKLDGLTTLDLKKTANIMAYSLYNRIYTSILHYCDGIPPEYMDVFYNNMGSNYKTRYGLLDYMTRSSVYNQRYFLKLDVSKLGARTFYNIEKLNTLPNQDEIIKNNILVLYDLSSDIYLVRSLYAMLASTNSAVYSNIQLGNTPIFKIDQLRERNGSKDIVALKKHTEDVFKKIGTNDNGVAIDGNDTIEFVQIDTVPASESYDIITKQLSGLMMLPSSFVGADDTSFFSNKDANIDQLLIALSSPFYKVFKPSVETLFPDLNITLPRSSTELYARMNAPLTTKTGE